MCNVKGAISTQHQECIQLLLFNSLDDLIRNVNGHFHSIPDHLARVGIASIRRAQDRTAARQNTPHFLQTQWNNSISFEESVISIPDPKYFALILIDGRLTC